MILAEKRNAKEDNFDEAVGMIWKASQPTKVSVFFFFFEKDILQQSFIN
jgi:hypothetical protein